MDWSRTRKLFRRGNLATSVVLFPAHIVQAYLVLCAVWAWLVTWWTTSDPALHWTRLDEVKLFFAVAAVTTTIILSVALVLPFVRQRWNAAAQTGKQRQAPTSIQPSTPVPRSLTAYEIEQKLRKCDELLEFVRDQTARIAPDGNQIRTNPWYNSRLGIDAYIERCQDFRNDLNSLASRIESIRSSNAHHPEVQSVLPKNDDLAKFSNAVTKFFMTLERLNKIKELSESDFLFLLEARDEELDYRVRQFAKWRNEAMTTLLNMRRTISG